MAEVERRDAQPEPTKEPEAKSGGMSRREFLVAGGTGLGGLIIGGVLGREVLGKPAPEPDPGGSIMTHIESGIGREGRPRKRRHVLQDSALPSRLGNHLRLHSCGSGVVAFDRD